MFLKAPASLSTVVFVAPVIFSRLQQRHQAFARELAALGFRVFFVEPFISPGWSVVAENVVDRLTVLKLRVPFKVSSVPALQRIVCRLAEKLLKKQLDCSISQAILWLAEPSLAALTELSWARILYDRCDLHGSFPGQKKSVWRRYEAEIEENACLISVSHPFLAESIISRRDKIVLAPNACSEAFLAQGQMAAPRRRLSAEITGDSAQSPIRLVSSGAHYEWVDCEWLKMLACLDAVELHIAGTGRGNAFYELLQLPNVKNHGHLNHSDLIQLLVKCDVGLIPFRDLPLIKGVDPIKAYEYAACGLEVWAPDLVPLHSNLMISRFIANPAAAAAALKEYCSAPQPFAGSIPVWKERLAPILARLL